MNTQKFSEAMNEINSRYVEEAVRYKKTAGKSGRIKWIAAAACLTLLLIGGGIFMSLRRHITVSAHTVGTDGELTAAGAVLDTGTINNNGRMTGHPLMFYLSGKDISSVRFSCKNQKISFTDWTEKRDSYGNVQNFTVPYGENESEYYYLTIDWIPEQTIRELTDNAGSSIAALPENLREDIIVMEISFANGKTAVKAIRIRLLSNGTFFASFHDYSVTEKDSFLSRPDSQPVSRNTASATESIGQEIAGTNAGQDAEADATQSAAAEANNHQTGTTETGDNGNDPAGTNAGQATEAEAAARAYYSGTVFKVESIKLTKRTENEIVFSVRVSKEGIVQDPDRGIILQLKGSVWEVVNEGY